MKEQLFLRAVGRDGRYWAEIYHYDETGRVVMVQWESDYKFDTKEEAIDFGADYADENDIDLESIEM